MAAAKKTARGRKQDRARVDSGQDYEVRYEAKKTRRSASVVKKAVKKVARPLKSDPGQRRMRSLIYSGGHSGQVSPIESSTSTIAARASSGEMQGGGFVRPMSSARWRACGSVRSRIHPCASHS
jgi:hypothetical protein